MSKYQQSHFFRLRRDFGSANLPLVLIVLLLCPVLGHAELFERITGATQVKKCDVKVLDRDTQEPVFGARVKLKYLKQNKYGRRSSKFKECEGEVTATTNSQGKAELRLQVENCPRVDVETEETTLIVEEPGYATYTWDFRMNSQTEVYLERLGFVESQPQIAIEYPKFVIDLDKFRENFYRLDTFNQLQDSERRTKSYFVLDYADEGDKNFSRFLEKAQYLADKRSAEFLKTILNRNYHLPWSFAGEDPKEGEYIYDVGREAAAAALLNIADLSLNELLPKSTDIPQVYLDYLKQLGIEVTLDEYWDYLSGVYVSKVRGFRFAEATPDPLLFVFHNLRKHLRPEKVADSFFRLHEIVIELIPHSDTYWAHYFSLDRDRIEAELATKHCPPYKDYVKRILPETTELPRIKKYLAYLYQEREFVYLAQLLEHSDLSMKTFLAEEVRPISSSDSPSGGTLSDCLADRMHEVTQKAKTAILKYLAVQLADQQMTDQHWLLRNLARHDGKHAGEIALEKYLSATRRLDVYSQITRVQGILSGSKDGGVTSLCREVYKDLQIIAQPRPDYFVLAKDRMAYLAATCQAEFGQFVTEFDAMKLIDILHCDNWDCQRRFIPISGSTSYELSDYAGTIWEGVEKYFPERLAHKILDQYFCSQDMVNDESRFFIVPKHLNNCVCVRFKRQLNQRLANATYTDEYFDYLSRCDNQSGTTYNKPTMPFYHEINKKTLQGLSNLVKGHNAYLTPVKINDDRFWAFFLGTESKDPPFTGSPVEWSLAIPETRAFPLLKSAMELKDETMLRAVLYACSLYPPHWPDNMTQRMRAIATGVEYPNYLLAANSLAALPAEKKVSLAACRRAAAHNLDIISRRDVLRYDEMFAFQLLVNLDLCVKTDNYEDYKKLMSAIFLGPKIGRYPGFQRKLEKIILSSGYDHQFVIESLLESQNPLDMVLGIELSRLTHFPLKEDWLLRMLENDNAFVRLSVAKYVKASLGRYPQLVSVMKTNSNRKVRALATRPTEVSP